MRQETLIIAFNRAGSRYLQRYPEKSCLPNFFKKHKNQTSAKQLMGIDSYHLKVIDFDDHELLEKLSGENKEVCLLLLKFESILKAMHNPNNLAKECYAALFGYSVAVDRVEESLDSPMGQFATGSRATISDLKSALSINVPKDLLTLKNMRREYFKILLNNLEPEQAQAPAATVSIKLG